MLIDGGPDPELTLRRIGANLPFFARRIDLLVLSHPHQDHVAGLVDVLDRFRVGAVAARRHPIRQPGVRPTPDRCGRRPACRSRCSGRARRSTSAPERPRASCIRRQADAEAPLPEGDINNGSVVLRLEFGGFSALLTGDAEAPIESALRLADLLEAVDVLKVGHHGSNSSTTPGAPRRRPSRRSRSSRPARATSTVIPRRRPWRRSRRGRRSRSSGPT